MWPISSSFAATGPRIQDIRATQNSFWDFLAALPGSMEGQIFMAMLIMGAIGMMAHYAMRWLQGQITGGLFNYMFISYPKRTGLAYAGIIGAALTAIASNVFVTDSGEFVGWLNVIWFGLTNGYAADSVANKGAEVKDP